MIAENRLRDAQTKKQFKISVCILYLVCILYKVYSLILVTIITIAQLLQSHNTHNRPQNTCEVIRYFRSFPGWFSFVL